jgi:hypothetical protein
VSEKMKPWFVTEPGGPMGRWPGVMEQGGRIIAFTVPDEKTAKELVDLRAQLATATNERDMLRGQLRVCSIVANGNAKKADRYMAERDAAITETTEQAWEIAKLRYYVESLERLLTPEQRQQAATEASAALALHNPPASVQPRE